MEKDFLGATTRRQFLVRGSALAGALAIGGAGSLLSGGSSAQAAGLTPARRRTYTALMEAVVVQPSLRLDPALAPQAADAFAAAYATWPEDRRREADGVLDALERESAPGAFSALDRDRRSRDLRERARVTSARPAGAERERLVLTDRALALAAVTLGQPDSGHQTVTV